MELQERIDLLVRLKEYLQANGHAWKEVKLKAEIHNPWFTQEFIDTAVNQICSAFLEKEALESWVAQYQLQTVQQQPKNIGIVMAGNIPLVGFHDLLTVFISGHQATIKLSAKDDILLKHIVQELYQWEITVQNYIGFAERLNGCDAYIATGSNNTSRYFEYYFGKYPSIIRKNRTSVAILDGTETVLQLKALSDDMQLYFGLGCRNVTKLYVPKEYDFIPLIEAVKKYSYLGDHTKYKNNYDYQLALALLNKQFYMTDGQLLFTENEANFSPISQVFYGYYTDLTSLTNTLQDNPDIQCIVGNNHIPFGSSQKPILTDYADGMDTMKFLHTL